MTLSFRLGGIPVRIPPSFFVGTGIIYLAGGQPELPKLAVWMAIVSASVLAHELGHALAGLAFGLRPSIALHGFGGTTSWKADERVTPVKRIVISLAGPAMGFAIGGLIKILSIAFGERIGWAPSSLAAFAYGNLLFVNVGWGVLNLLPMLPLDGGNVMTHALDLAIPGRAEPPARVVSLVVAGLATAIALVSQQYWPAILAGSFIATNWRELKELRARAHDAPMRTALEQAYVALDAKDGQRVLALSRPVVLGSQTVPVRAEALQLLAFGLLLEGRVSEADAAIAALPPGFAPHPSLLELRTTVANAHSG